MLKVLKFPSKVNYITALSLQSELVRKKLLNRSNEPDYLILLEHEACITLGRRSHCDKGIGIEGGTFSSTSSSGNVPVIKVKHLAFDIYPFK